MYRVEIDYFEVLEENKRIKELLKIMFEASNPKEFTDAQIELKKYV